MIATKRVAAYRSLRRIDGLRKFARMLRQEREFLSKIADSGTEGLIGDACSRVSMCVMASADVMPRMSRFERGAPVRRGRMRIAGAECGRYRSTLPAATPGHGPRKSPRLRDNDTRLGRRSLSKRFIHA
jgi:hypothetical protein